jgi:hypothetical protein
VSTLAERVNSILIELADCLCREIAARDMPEPCFCGVLPGDAASFMHCNLCEGGQAWVRLIAVGMPNADIEMPMNRCVGTLAVQIEMGMVFGWLPVDEDGDPKDMSDNLAAVERQTAEMDVMYHVLTCCGLSMQEPVSNLGYNPVGPTGTCLGGIWTGMVQVI